MPSEAEIIDRHIASSSAATYILGPGGLFDANGQADAVVLDADADTSISSPTDDQIDIEISGADDFTFTANTFTCLSGSKISLLGGGGAASTSGILLGGGTTASPQTTATADGKFVELKCSTTAASGDNRLAYFWYYIEGAGGGECLRAMTAVNENIGTAHGAHLSLSYEAAAGGSETSGLGAAVRGTTHIPDVASWAPTGTVCSGMFELYSDGTASDPAGLTELSVLRLCNSGDATGAADVDTDAFLLSVQGFTAAADTTKVLSSVSLAELPAGTVGLRVKIGSSTYYIPCVAVAEWN